MSKRTILALSAVTAIVAGFLLVAAPSASAASTPRGHIYSARQSTATHTVQLKGCAYDPSRPAARVQVVVYFDGHRVRTQATNRLNRPFNRAHHLRGSHSFTMGIRAPRHVRTVVIRVLSRQTGRLVVLSRRHPTQVAPPSARIIAAAKKYYQRGTPYVMGGTTPRGFDCSGYSQYVYREAKVPGLPRTAEQQRRAVRHLSRSQARPGDLVFYLSGGQAYHVAIYAGHGMQYAAATPRDGLRYQQVWSSAVQYGTTWHR